MANNIYVMNDDENMIYELSIDSRNFYAKGADSYWVMSLNLICGKDWVEVNDYGGTQGWIPAEYFTDTFDNLVVYPMKESIEDCLNDWGYKIIDKLPRIQTPKE